MSSKVHLLLMLFLFAFISIYNILCFWVCVMMIDLFSYAKHSGADQLILIMCEVVQFIIFFGTKKWNSVSISPVIVVLSGKTFKILEKWTIGDTLVSVWVMCQKIKLYKWLVQVLKCKFSNTKKRSIASPF